MQIRFSSSFVSSQPMASRAMPLPQGKYRDYLSINHDTVTFSGTQKATLASIKAQLASIPAEDRSALENTFRPLIANERWGYTLFDNQRPPARAVSGIWFTDPQELAPGWAALGKHRDRFPIHPNYLLISQLSNGGCSLLIHKQALLARLDENKDVLQRCAGDKATSTSILTALEQPGANFKKILYGNITDSSKGNDLPGILYGYGRYDSLQMQRTFDLRWGKEPIPVIKGNQLGLIEKDIAKPDVRPSSPQFKDSQEELDYIEKEWGQANNIAAISRLKWYRDKGRFCRTMYIEPERHPNGFVLRRIANEQVEFTSPLMSGFRSRQAELDAMMRLTGEDKKVYPAKILPLLKAAGYLRPETIQKLERQGFSTDPSPDLQIVDEEQGVSSQPVDSPIQPNSFYKIEGNEEGERLSQHYAQIQRELEKIYNSDDFLAHILLKLVNG